MIALHIDSNKARQRDLRRVVSSEVTILGASDLDAGLAEGLAMGRIDLLVVQVAPEEPGAALQVMGELLARFPQMVVMLTTPQVLDGRGKELMGQPLFRHPLGQEAVRHLRSGGIPLPRHTETTRPGEQIGDYQFLERLALGDSTETYRALQLSIHREVALELLKAECQDDPGERQRFRAKAKLMASVSHQHVAPVFEAKEADGRLYYARELLHGESLQTMVEHGALLADKDVANILRIAAEAMIYLEGEGIPHRPITAADIYLDDKAQVRLENVAIDDPTHHRSPESEIETLLVALKAVVPRGRALSWLEQVGGRVKDWEEMRELAFAQQARLREESTHARFEPPPDLVVEKVRRVRKRYLFAVLILLVVIAVGVWSGKVLDANRVPLAQQDIWQRTGEFIYGDPGETVRVRGFYIDRYEVTIGQYAEFLEAVELDPQLAERVRHPDQPRRDRSNEPDDWGRMYHAARRGGIYRGVRLGLDHPVVGVDWYDAQAYAAWRGRRLPTEKEWEKAARGEKGQRFPWGDEYDPAAANLGADYSPDGKGGEVDGFALWAPVNAHPKDSSPSGVEGMAGNVEEWTATEASHPDFPDRIVPIVRGGSFASPPGEPMSVRRFARDRSESSPMRGFRTAVDVERGRDAE
jgi:formylglycine-generating enzyme required for sulfatase activity